MSYFYVFIEIFPFRASSSINQIKKRRSGAGRRVKYQIFDEDLAKWLKSELDSGKNPSRSQIQLKALEMAQSKGVDINKDFKVSFRSIVYINFYYLGVNGLARKIPCSS